MGEFDKCHMCMGILNDLGSILGLNCIIIRFMYVFLRLRSVLAFSSFFIVDLSVSSQVIGEKQEVEAN